MSKTETARRVFFVGLKNAHAVEKLALSMQPQPNRLTHDPRLSRPLEQHLWEIETQINRLDEILNSLDERSSTMKDTFLSTVESMVALGHVDVCNEELKNTFAELTVENHEIAVYISVLTESRASGERDCVALLERSLEEERRMAA